MKTIAWDLETHLLKPGQVAPRMVCLSFANNEHSGLLDRLDGVKWVRQALTEACDGKAILVGHNVVYDLGVVCAEDSSLLPLVFRALDLGSIRDTMIRQKLIDIARGELGSKRTDSGDYVKTKHSLAALVELYFARELPKTDTYRLRYHELDGVPLSDWPEEASRYAIDDAKETLNVWQAQEAFIHNSPEKDGLFPDRVLPNEVEQNRAAWALQLMTIWGVRTDGKRVSELKDKLEKICSEATEKLLTSGIMRMKGTKKNPKPTKDTKEIKARVTAEYKKLGLPLQQTPTGGVKISAEVLSESGDPDLMVLAEASKSMKLLSTYVPALEKGTVTPICARYNVLVESGRTSSGGGETKVNMQNPPRLGNVRECFVPRTGHLYAGCDYDTLELRALAEVNLAWFGESQLAEAFRRGEDPHLSLAATMLDITIEEARERKKAGDPVVKDKRQFSKVANFGYPGGLGAERFVFFAKRSGLTVTVLEAEALRNKWFATWPEMKKYFFKIGWMTAATGECTIRQLTSGRVRGGVKFTEAANSFFQGLAADGAKQALWDVSKECYLDRKSALFGSRPVLFLHDELILEVPENRAADAAERLAVVMREAMQVWIPSVPITCSPVLMNRWTKDADTVRDANGKLQTWVQS